MKDKTNEIYKFCKYNDKLDCYPKKCLKSPGTYWCSRCYKDNPKENKT